MMKQWKMLALAFTLMGMSAMAQDDQLAVPETEEDLSESVRKKNETDTKIYQLALRYNDVSIARAKLFELIERNPQNIRYRELLASLYFESNQFPSSALAALDALEINDKSPVALEVAAYSLEQLGALDRALPRFESLYLITGDIFSLYKTAYIQYSLEKFNESLSSINMLIKDNKSTETMLEFPNGENETQQVSIKAAAYNLKGIIFKDQDSPADAREAFNQALELEPEFQLAKQNLEEL